MKKINEECVKYLIEEMEKNNGSKQKVFEKVAKKFDVNKYSVRNFYYKFILLAGQDEKLKKQYKVNLEKHKKQTFARFSECQEQLLKTNIENKLKQGFSLRKACLSLANGDIDLMIRYQNKYRNIVKESKQDSVKNIIKFPSQNKFNLSDSQLKNILTSVVKMVKDNAISQTKNFNRSKLEIVKGKLLSTSKQVCEKHFEIETLKNENLKLTKTIESLKNQLKIIRAENINSKE